MLLHDARASAAQSRRPSQSASLRLPDCPQCGDALLAPLLAEHVDASHVRNHWVCESCGHSFRKSHKFAVSVDEDLVA